MDKMSKIVCAISALGAVAIAWQLGTQYLAVKGTEVANEAKYQCAQSSRYQTTDKNGATVWYPVEELYKKCLKEKGL